jgi:hypothetical protein
MPHWRGGECRPLTASLAARTHGLSSCSELRHVHEIIEPATYCEIGCRLGISLALSRAPSCGIDPDFEIRTELTVQTRLYRKTSDAFFATVDITNVLGAPINFAFIDGIISSNMRCATL